MGANVCVLPRQTFEYEVVGETWLVLLRFLFFVVPYWIVRGDGELKESWIGGCELSGAYPAACVNPPRPAAATVAKAESVHPSMVNETVCRHKSRKNLTNAATNAGCAVLQFWP